ncbi:MAG TPA: hypothetical protein PK239_02925 [Chitinophagales bacterium]|nr:hypothetical protein [Chitinophagales bacterium]
MIHKFLIALACFCLFNLSVKAQLYCANLSSKPVWIAVVYHYTPIENGEWKMGSWVANGWIYINPGDTTQLTTHIGAHPIHGLAYEFYYFAYHPYGKEWTGTRRFLTNVDPMLLYKPDVYDYTILNADKVVPKPDSQYLPDFAFNYATGQRYGNYLIILRDTD